MFNSRPFIWFHTGPLYASFLCDVWPHLLREASVSMQPVMCVCLLVCLEMVSYFSLLLLFQQSWHQQWTEPVGHQQKNLRVPDCLWVRCLFVNYAVIIWLHLNLFLTHATPIDDLSGCCKLSYLDAVEREFALHTLFCTIIHYGLLCGLFYFLLFEIETMEVYRRATMVGSVRNTSWRNGRNPTESNHRTNTESKHLKFTP